MTGPAHLPQTPSEQGDAVLPRGRTLTVAIVWGALVAALLIAVPLALRDRLPDPLATHWSGSTPDGHMSFAGNLVFDLGLWAVAWIFLLGTALRRRTSGARLWRVYWWGFLFGWAVLALGVMGSILYANLDVADWHQATMPVWLIVAVVGAAAGAGVLAGWLGRGGPDPVRDRSAELPRLRLRPGQRAVWVSRVSNPWLTGLSTVLLVVAAIAGGLATTGVLSVQGFWSILPALVLVMFLLRAMGSASARVDADGLRVGFGPFGRPARHTPISKIESAWVEKYGPGDVGGWGLRGLPGTGRVTLMLRGGDCLVIRRTTGGEFAVSVDDAERGAALLNAYIAEAVSS
ncbi:hypothetical protein [Streptosporangium sp. NPDC087985]|uniref:hypothetical protein n=1 Tax=Streptosporangium sp. NPDC087985 TaxID=3366196 RepID=UPI0037F453DF